MSKAIKDAVGRLAARFDAMSQRERALVAVAVVVGIAVLGKSLFVDPALARAAGAERQVQQQRGEVATVEAVLQTVRAQLAADPDAANKARLAALQAEKAEVEAGLRAVEDRLVSPERMNALLERMLARHSGLRLLSLKSLPPVSLAAPATVTAPTVAAATAGNPAAAGPAASGAAAGSPVVATEAAGLYRHGVELRLEGSYADLHAWLAQLESAPQRLLWGDLRFEVVEHPRAQLTLTVFTLSADKAWLTI